MSSIQTPLFTEIPGNTIRHFSTAVWPVGGSDLKPLPEESNDHGKTQYEKKRRILAALFEATGLDPEKFHDDYNSAEGREQRTQIVAELNRTFNSRVIIPSILQIPAVSSVICIKKISGQVPNRERWIITEKPGQGPLPEAAIIDAIKTSLGGQNSIGREFMDSARIILPSHVDLGNLQNGSYAVENLGGGNRRHRRFKDQETAQHLLKQLQNTEKVKGELAPSQLLLTAGMGMPTWRLTPENPEDGSVSDITAAENAVANLLKDYFSQSADGQNKEKPREPEPVELIRNIGYVNLEAFFPAASPE